ncbi:RNA-binding Raly-like protein [Holothuria leucospilota]|uniref:RNA-binding Raly-like protein n=1 Tax=Holothuria leucospilota TaxID=206669 RepID=A0A9Q1HE93_HOLLE|nr:RNA-binding Raly-like protein [Holothuria leucospilota]
MNRPPFMGIPRGNPGLGFQPIGKMTNSQDPKSKASRVFVGNLNTGVVKEDKLVEIFSKYGPISAVSLIKGFGFVQFTNEFHARKAVQGEHGRVIADQPMGI